MESEEGKYYIAFNESTAVKNALFVNSCLSIYL